MKKILIILTAAITAVSCSSTKNAKTVTPYPFFPESGNIFYSFDSVESEEIKDESKNALTALFADSTVSAKEAAEGGSLLLDGQKAHLSLDKSILDGDGFTLSIKINPERWEYWQRVFDIGNGSDCDVWLGFDKSTKALRFSCADVSCYTKLPSTDEWTTVAVSFGQGQAAIYVEGELIQTVECSLTAERLSQGVKGLYIGRSNWNDPFFKGKIDNLFIAKTVLSEKKIKEIAKGICISSPEGFAK